MVRQKTLRQAEDGRDALARELYSVLFYGVIDKINRNLRSGNKHTSSNRYNVYALQSLLCLWLSTHASYSSADLMKGNYYRIKTQGTQLALEIRNTSTTTKTCCISCLCCLFLF